MSVWGSTEGFQGYIEKHFCQHTYFWKFPRVLPAADLALLTEHDVGSFAVNATSCSQLNDVPKI